MTIEEANRKYVFVCGLHRSGTTVLARIIGKMENCTAFEKTGAYGDEGQFLQDVYPTDGECGGVGRFAFDPRAHLTETSPLLTAENVVKLRESWHKYWDKSKSICVEKTPRNILMTRFLQAVFPNAYFVVIRRHPVPVSMSTQKWKWNFTSLHRLFDHWLRCHELFEEDRKHLRHLYELYYEDYILNPAKYHQEIAGFIGTRNPEGVTEELTDAHDKLYFDRWSNLLTKSFFRSYYRYIARKYGPRFAVYNYSLVHGVGTGEQALGAGDKTSNALGVLYCIGANAYSVLYRYSSGHLRQRIKALLPKPLRVRVRRIHRRT